jgi:phosphotransferase system  glucose/maltose/N-acetylglucosamine-specific IIC component
MKNIYKIIVYAPTGNAMVSGTNPDTVFQRITKMTRKKIFLSVAIIVIIAILLFIIFFCFIKQEPIRMDTDAGFGRLATEQQIDKDADREREDINRETIEKEIKIRDGTDSKR